MIQFIMLRFLKINIFIAVSLMSLSSECLFFNKASAQNMDTYTPPPMFGASLQSSKNSQKSRPKKNTIQKPIYFKPPLPPKRPKSFLVSEEYLERLKKGVHPKTNTSRQKPALGSDILNDTGNDIRIMNATDIHDSISRSLND